MPKEKLTPLDLFSGKHAQTEKTIEKSLTNVFSYLDMSPNLSKEIIAEIFKICKNNKNINHAQKQLRELMKSHSLGEKIKEKLLFRSSQVYNQIKHFVVGKTVLDLGCGNGKVGEALNKDGFDVKLADVVDYNESGLPFDLYDGSALPYQSNSVDTTLILLVLHHCDEPVKVLEEAIRVTGKRIVIIESIFQNEEERKFNIFMDWFYNRIFSYKDVNVPLNFRTPEDWRKLFSEYNLKLIRESDFGIDLPIVPEHHWLFVLEK